MYWNVEVNNLCICIKCTILVVLSDYIIVHLSNLLQYWECNFGVFEMEYLKTAKFVFLLGQGLMRLDKRRGDFIYARRLSVYTMHSKSSEHSVERALMTATCSQLSLSHTNYRICDCLRSVSCVLDIQFVSYGYTQLYWRCYHPRESYAQRRGKPKYILGHLNNADLNVSEILLN